jgi:hypothetical protein
MVTPKVETVSAQPQTLREKPEPVQSGLTAAQVQAVHTALKLLSAMCDGARELDGAGFNKMDTLFGHSLAERTTLTNNQAEAGKRLVLKYHRQLPADLLVAIRGA